MAELTVEFAQSQAEMTAVQDLCRSFRQWLYDNYPRHRPVIDAYYNPQKFEALLVDLPQIHKRPKGAILLARLDGEPVGCVMHHEQGPGIAEMKRLFVSAAARGRGIAAALCEASMARAKDDGYHSMRLDTGILQTAAQGLYRRLGFRERDAYYPVPPALEQILLFFEREL
ncbi:MULTISPECIES: GNAT family N-acetyltransferase [unclassified Rhizobium]|uniref:GNAT family N-acetyltransferase n=1 Tax=unclassified Rhizobium TaxID=2613769 RepID=UPI001C83ED0E|nr:MULTISPECIES: GNAT family N-acetyltransferase [unclassified Rhizobium]MBX5158644.1 GNAT family N-acetyltransferase [Rhizobium sp. NZLR8]MBX5163953.1 GNAT family N-acetyltransferase [Rhizobium sp. NZLR4b]MBX5207941.1 GNAT family N-acetyltransferase [Rhizobium sp. NZLR11]